MNKINLHLRIQKKFMDEIRKGEKKIEYRKNSEFYRRMFQGKQIESITLHYQRPERLTFEVGKIELIDRPARFDRDPMLPTKKVFAIHVKRVSEWIVST